jgi:hypothetical protein
LYQGRNKEIYSGEDAPSYLPSRKAPPRIAEFYPDIKLLILLRDPVERTWSNYWHNVRTYNAFFSFEETLRLFPEHLVDRSCYKGQIKRYLTFFDRRQFLFIIFEDLLRDFKRIMMKISNFLALPQFEYEPVHANKGRYPKNLRLALLRNYLYRDLFGNHYRRILPNMPEPKKLSLQRKIGLRIFSKLDWKSTGSPPVMNSETRLFLNRLLRRENKGLDQIINRNLSAVWPSFADDAIS